MSVVTDTGLAAPFLGLRYFDEEHSHLFFGRDVQINDVLEKLRRSRLVTVMGSSGSGKSSLVRAGVIPRLKAGLLGEAGPRWRIAKVRPGSSPIASLARELEKALSAQGLEVTLRRGPLGLVQAVEECRLSPTENVLVIADQFEEVFRYQRESSQPKKTKEDAAAFVKLLLEATSQRMRAIYVIVTMRSDYLGNCAQFRDLPERINEGLYLVPRMRRDQLEEAVAGPVAVEDAEITPRLLQKLLNETGDDPDQLPVLQHALLRAWNAWNRAPQPLDLEDLDAVGGMKGGLSRHADEVFTGLSIDQQRIARVVFQQLSERDAEGREIRRPAPVAQIAAVAGATEQAADQVVERFAAPDAAFLYRNEDGHLDIAHESLLRKWSRIQGVKQGGTDGKGWMQEEAEARDEFLLLVERAAKKDTLMGRALDDALSWRALGLNAAWAGRYARGGGANVFEDVVRFVDECQLEDVSRRRRRKWWRIGAMAAVSVVLVAITVLWRSADGAARQARVASARTSTQDAARLIAENRSSLAFAHLARALRLAPEEIAAASWLSDSIRGRELWIPDTPLASRGPIHSAAFSPDGRYIVTNMGNGFAELWDTVNGELVREFPNDAPKPQMVGDSDFYSAAFSPNGRRILATSSEQAARVWDVASGQSVGMPLQHKGALRSATFSPDGRRVVTASADHTARIWIAETGEPVTEPLAHFGDVYSAAFSPDGRRVVTTSADHTARIWDAMTGRPMGPALSHSDSVRSAAFSADGRRILTASNDGTARVWDVATGKPVGGVLRHQSSVTSAAFSPDGRRVITASEDTVRVWDADTGGLVGVLQHLGDVHSAVFSPDGRRILTTSEDTTARVWDAAAGRLVGVLQHQRGVSSATFCPDGRRIVTASADTTARVWHATTTQFVAVVPLEHDGDVWSAVFSPDGRHILTASEDATARLWDSDTGRLVGSPLRHEGPVTSAAFSPDGRRVITASEDTTARVWDVATGKALGEPLRHPGKVVTAVLSPDGSRIITMSEDSAQLWDTATGRPVGAPLRPSRNSSGVGKLEHVYITSAVFSPNGRMVLTAWVNHYPERWDAITGQRIGEPLESKSSGNPWAAFSPDGRQIVTTSLGGSEVEVWNAGTGQRVGVPIEHGDTLQAVFSPDGGRIVTASSDTTARVWNAVTGEAVAAPLQHLGKVVSAAFSPDGRRIVTASEDTTARLWDAGAGQPASAALPHESAVRSAIFSPDGHRVVTASGSRAWVWDVLLGSGSVEDALLLADLAEVLGGYRVNEVGSLVPLEGPERLQRIRNLVGPEANGFVPLDVLLKRFLPASR